MKDTLMIFLIPIAIIAMIISTIVSGKKKKFKKRQNEFDEFVKASKNARQVEKYEAIMTVNTYLKAACYIIFVLCAIFFIFLPVFKMQIFEELKAENFSLYEALTSLKNEETNSTHFTDVDKKAPFIVTIIFTAVFICGAALSVCSVLKTLNEKGRAEYYARLKLKMCNPMIDPLSVFIALLTAPITAVIVLKNAKLALSSNKEYAVTDIGRYLIYNDANGVIVSVYKNNFKFCTGVSGYIAVPILFFVLGVVIAALCFYIDGKLKQLILKDDVAAENQVKEISD